LDSSDGELDFESHPSILPVEMTMVGLVKRSGKDTQFVVEKEDEEADNREAPPSQGGGRNSGQKKICPQFCSLVSFR
jgi:hypothetical protein